MEFERYDFAEIEPQLLKYWQDERLRERANEQNVDGEPFYFCDGPPYTTGNVHVGHAWNKSMKDVVCRFRRMQGRNVWDRAGYDMHGLPNEHAAMRELGLTSKEEIQEYGVEKYSLFCRDLAVKRLKEMNEQFTRLGVWMDFDDAYQTISDQWIDAQWYLIKKAHEKGRLYKGMRSMAWDPEHETALAKHELVYNSVEDQSIYVKFKSLAHDNEYFVIWTTTPWTIPWNLMIMMNPDAEYARVQVENEIWILASDLVQDVLDVAETEGTVISTHKGNEFAGVAYQHFFAEHLDYASLKESHPNVHTVVLSKEYVTTDGGTGLVHAAPGCGPEDYEVGVQNDVPAWNLIDERGYFPLETSIFAGKRARYEDTFFIEQIDQAGALVGQQGYVHDYPFAQRSKAPCVFRTTEQWFFKVADLKEQMIAQNNEVHWQPQAGFNAFNSWLENLRDNSITKQRFWGTPFPMWMNPENPDDYFIVSSKAELEELSGQTIEHMHKPWIDSITIKKDGTVYHRSPDVVDVWVDAGVASWACLHYPQRTDLFEKYFPADFIIEGNDQVRGWFNLMMVAGTLAFDVTPFKNVYMHGMINDAHGRKMSKSEGNYILPQEVIDKYGADTFRFYTIGGTRAGLDLNYNFDDCQKTQRNLLVFWNVHKYMLDLHKQCGFLEALPAELTREDQYILSRAHTTAKNVQELLDLYAIDRIPAVIERFFFDVSRVYIQLIRPLIASGSEQDKKRVLAVLNECFSIGVRLLAPICPFITEALWKNLRQPFGYEHESVHLAPFPTALEDRINLELEESMYQAQQLISVILAGRDQAKVGVRWPLADVQVLAEWTLDDEFVELVKQQTNVKQIKFEQSLPVSATVEPNFRALGKAFGDKTADIVVEIKRRSAELGQELLDKGAVTVAEEELTEEYFVVTRTAPEGFVFATDGTLQVLLSTAQSEELLKEGYARELTRRIQSARKAAELDKTDTITLTIDPALSDLEPYLQDLAAVVGASSVTFAEPRKSKHVDSAKVKEREITFGFSRSN